MRVIQNKLIAQNHALNVSESDYLKHGKDDTEQILIKSELPAFELTISKQ